MIPVPAHYVAAVDRTHAPRWRASILDAAGTVVIPNLPIIDGRISRTTSAAPSATASVVIPTAAIPGPLDQRYLPTGGRIRLQWNIRDWPDWVTMADLDMVESDLQRPDALWTVNAVDRSIRIGKDNTARGAWVQPSGSIAAAITAIVRRTFPDTVVQASGRATTQQVPPGTHVDGDPWSIAGDLAEQAGAEVRIRGYNRVCIIRDRPEIGEPVDMIRVGEYGGITGYTLRHEMGYNTVAIEYTAKGSDVLVTGRAVDDRPESPVAVSRIGSHVVLVMKRQTDAAPTQAEADAAAAALLVRSGGRSRSPEVRHVARPWLEPGDTVTVTYTGGVSEAQLVDSVDIPLGTSNIQTTRMRSNRYTMGEPA